MAKFAKELLQELCWEDVGKGFEGLTVVSNEVTGKSRWADIHTLVFSFEGKFYQTDYRTGSTEMQDESPFEWNDDEIDCKEVEPYEVTVTKYRPIK